MKKKILIILISATTILGSFALWARNSSSQTTIFQLIKSFSQAMELIENYYVYKIDPPDLVRWAIRGMVSKLDPHSNYLTEKQLEELRIRSKGKYGGLGFTVGMPRGKLTIISPFEGTPAYRAGLQPRDGIKKIDGISTSGMTLNEAVDKMRGTPGTKVTLTISRQGTKQEMIIPITREIIELKNVRYCGIIDKDIGYIKFMGFSEHANDELAHALDSLLLMDCNKFILDLRMNSGGLLDQAVKVSDLFLSPGKLIVSTKGRNPNLTRDYYSMKPAKTQNLPLIVLVNGASASASEIVAGAIQDWELGLIVGDTTFGKGSVQSVKQLAAGALKLTTARYYTPTGKCIDRCDTTRFLIRNPTLDSTYTTRGPLKREIVSHGAIVPDIVLKEPKPYSPLITKAQAKDYLIDKFSSYYVSKNPSLKQDFKINSSILHEFKKFIKDKGVEFTESEFDSAVPDIKIVLKRMIARAQWGERGEYSAMLELDPWIKQATKLISHANSVEKLFTEAGIK